MKKKKEKTKLTKVTTNENFKSTSLTKKSIYKFLIQFNRGL